MSTLATIPYKDRKDRNMKRTAGTCEWFTRHHIFRAWQTREAPSPLLWVSAYPGCGKSVLLRYLVDDYLKHPDRTVCYYFFKDDFEDQKSVTHALRCIIHQVLKQQPELLTSEILGEFARDAQLLDSLVGLWDIFLQICQSQSSREIFCVFDALDECYSSQLQQFVETLVRWSENSGAKGRIRILVTSRLYADVKRGLSELGPEIHLSGEGDKEMGEISREINLVLAAKVEDVVKRLDLSKSQEDILKQELSRVPNKTYLWAHLVIDHIKTSFFDCDDESLRQAVRTLQKSVDESYERILSRSGEREKVKKLLSIIIAAKRPLTVRTLAEAWAVKPGQRLSSELTIASDSRYVSMLHDLCGLMVIAVGERVYLLHQTVREFLLASSYTPLPVGNSPDIIWKGSIDEDEADSIMATICSVFLLLQDLPEIQNGSLYDNVAPRSSAGVNRDSHLATYAARFWVAHVRGAGDMAREELLLLATQLCDPSLCSFQRWSQVYFPLVFGLDCAPEDVSSLIVAVSLNLPKVVDLLLKAEFIDLEFKDST
ncbi:uncharacterized protein B0I36DRAFT_247223, partial [Microdochium trichocladiopsis]